MRGAPGGDVLVLVAIGDGAADHEKQHLRLRMQDAPHVARVFDLGEMVEQRREARLPRQGLGGQDHERLRFRGRIDSEKPAPVTCHTISG